MGILGNKASKIGNSLRSNQVRKTKPGPGDYDITGQLPNRSNGIS